MIANKLAVLMAERQLSIKQVVEATNISRNTISNISNNPKANISLETVDNLCMFFGITPSDFFEYSPYRISLHIVNFSGIDETIINIGVENNHKEYTFPYDIALDRNVVLPEPDRGYPQKYDMYGIVSDSSVGENVSYQNIENADSGFLQILARLSPLFKNDIMRQIETTFSEILATRLKTSRFSNTDFMENVHNQKKPPFISDYFKSKEKENISIAVAFPWGDVFYSYNFQNGRLKRV